jgi:hypothetical protein
MHDRRLASHALIVPHPQDTDFTVGRGATRPRWITMSTHADLPEQASPSDPAVLRARSPEDLLALVPYHLGFHPEHSLVALSLNGPRRRFGFTARFDLPPLPQVPEVARHLVELVKQHRPDGLLLVVYAADDEVAGPLVHTLQQWLGNTDVDLVDAYRSDGRRWFCYICDRACCPDEGTPYDLSDHPLVAEMVLRGQVALPDREALRERVGAVTGERRAAMEEAFARAGGFLTDAFCTDALGVRRVRPEESVRTRMRWVRRFVAGWLAAPRQLSDEEAARLAVAVAVVPARDTAWSMMSRATAAQHLQLWEQVLTRVVPPYEPAVACLTAFAAWLEGHGALAWCAVERALAADPAYSWAALIVQSLEQAVSPSTWRPVPPEHVERFAG